MRTIINAISEAMPRASRSPVKSGLPAEPPTMTMTPARQSPAATKVANVLPELRADELDDGRFVVSGFGSPTVAAMGMLRSAVRDNRRLALVYRDERERVTERTCLPLAVIYYIEVTVLAASCELRDDFRHFRADRIVTCHETGDSFADLAPQLQRDWGARRGMPGQGRDGRWRASDSGRVAARP